MVLVFDGRALKRARALRGYTQRTLAPSVARLTGRPCSWWALKSYEREVREPSFLTAMAIASILRVEAMDLITEREEAPYTHDEKHRKRRKRVANGE